MKRSKDCFASLTIECGPLEALSLEGLFAEASVVEHFWSKFVVLEQIARYLYR